jgi:hypothetical protein
MAEAVTIKLCFPATDASTVSFRHATPDMLEREEQLRRRLGRKQRPQSVTLTCANGHTRTYSTNG